MAKGTGDRQGEATSLGNLGIAYDSLGESAKACELWRRALLIFETIGSPFAEVARESIERNCSKK